MARSRPFSPTHPVFAQLSTQVVGGSASATQDLDHLKIRWIQQRRLRAELLATLNGDDIELELAMRRACREPVRTTARELRMDPSTVCRRGAEAVRRVHIGVVARIVRALIIRDRGATLSVADARPIAARPDEYAVSLKGYGQAFSSLPDVRELAAWIDSQWTTLCSPEESIACVRPVRFIGAWIDARTGRGDLDVSVAVTGELEARRIASENAQRAICHLCTKRVIYLDE